MPSPDLPRAFAAQLAHPRGLGGRLLGGAMDMVNRRPTRRAIDLLAPAPGERVLDAGCGTGAAMAELLRRAPCRLAGVDLSEAMLGIAARRLGTNARLQCCSIAQMRFDEGVFDAALALNVLYFCDAEHRMIASIHRALKPGGRLVTFVTDRRSMERWSFARKGIHRLFDRDALTDALVAGGFARDAISVHSEPLARSVIGLFAIARR